jgi:hypothetical protein
MTAVTKTVQSWIVTVFKLERKNDVLRNGALLPSGSVRQIGRLTFDRRFDPENLVKTTTV